MELEYRCVEIVSKKKIVEYARIRSHSHINFFLNQNDNLIFMENRGAKRNVFEIFSFNKSTGVIQNAHRVFDRNIPMNFLSPSFHHYIDIESNLYRIRVLDTFTDEVVQILPTHLHKFMCPK